MTIGGLWCSAVSLLLGAYFLLLYLFRGIGVYGWTALMLAELFFVGIILILLGIVGEYVGRILMNVNQIPQFVVKECVNGGSNAAPARKEPV